MRAVAAVAAACGSGAVELTLAGQPPATGCRTRPRRRRSRASSTDGLALDDPRRDAARAVVASPLHGHDPAALVDAGRRAGRRRAAARRRRRRCASRRSSAWCSTTAAPGPSTASMPTCACAALGRGLASVVGDRARRAGTARHGRRARARRGRRGPAVRRPRRPDGRGRQGVGSHARRGRARRGRRGPAKAVRTRRSGRSRSGSTAARRSPTATGVRATYGGIPTSPAIGATWWRPRSSAAWTRPRWSRWRRSRPASRDVAASHPTVAGVLRRPALPRLDALESALADLALITPARRPPLARVGLRRFPGVRARSRRHARGSRATRAGGRGRGTPAPLRLREALRRCRPASRHLVADPSGRFVAAGARP